MNLFKRYCQALLLAIAVLTVSARVAHADLSSYTFGAGTGSGYDMSDANLMFGGDNYMSVSDADIGFTFYLDGVSYDHFSASTNGLIGLGNSYVTYCGENRLTSTGWGCGDPYSLANGVAQIAPFWDDIYISSIWNNDPADGSVSYKVFGDAPNRVLVIEYRNVAIDVWNDANSTRYGTFQLRLYEGSNKIEFWYEHMDPAYDVNSMVNGVAGASIGIAMSSSNFASVTPDGMGGASVSYTDANDAVVTADTPIPDNTLYTFNPCHIQLAGDPSQGGTRELNDGDLFFDGVSIQHGGVQDFQPLTLSLDGSPCTSRDYRLTLSGPNAADYQISPNNGTVLAGESATPIITFSPTGNGVRRAALTVTDDNGFSRTFNLGGSGSTRIEWIGNTITGGTTTANDGDTLMTGARVDRHASASFSPITITNFNDNPAATPAIVTFVLDDPSGQFSLNTSEAGQVQLAAGESVTPVITFAPTGVSYQQATLTVTADGEAPRTYLLRAFSAAPGADFLAGSEKLGATSGLFVGTSGCVGSSIYSQTVTVRNIGAYDFILKDASFYDTDTAYAQGASPYGLLRDENGGLMQSHDYIVTLAPVTSQAAANQGITFPIVVPEGQSTTLYITYIGQYPGKRYARAFFRSNGENFLGTDTNMTANGIPPVMTEGLLTFDLFGRAIGSSLSDNVNGGLPKPITFANTQVGQYTDVTYTITNPGLCDLRISKQYMQIVAGDVEDFKLLNAFTGVQLDQSTGEYVIPSNGTASFTVRFSPIRSGSRRASLWFQSNDSTVSIAGVFSRGNYYLDLYGVGLPNKQSGLLDFGAAAMGSDSVDDVAMFTNETTDPIVITALSFGGVDASEFLMAAPTWPTLPTSIYPGKSLNLGVRFAPAASGVAGSRQAVLQALTSAGETFTVALNGVAGNRALTLNPGAVTFPPIASGKQSRQVISITNTGTMPVTLSATPTLSGTNAADFSLSAFPRLVLAPNQIEYLEVTYSPAVAGTSNAMVNFLSNVPGGTQSVSLSAQASKTQLVLDPSNVIHVDLAGASQPVLQTISVRNEGSETVRVTDIAFTGTDAAQFHVRESVGEIAGNSEQMLTVEVLPNGHDLSAQLQVQAVNEVTGEQVLRIAPLEASQQKTSGVAGQAVAGSGMVLEQNVPNPAQSDVTIGYRLSTAGEVSLGLYDGAGRLVRVLEQGMREQGSHELHVNVGDLPSGVYHYRLDAAGQSLVRSLTIVK